MQPRGVAIGREHGRLVHATRLVLAARAAHARLVAPRRSAPHRTQVEQESQLGIFAHVEHAPHPDCFVELAAQRQLPGEMIDRTEAGGVGEHCLFDQ